MHIQEISLSADVNQEQVEQKADAQPLDNQESNSRDVDNYVYAILLLGLLLMLIGFVRGRRL